GSAVRYRLVSPCIPSQRWRPPREQLDFGDTGIHLFNYLIDYLWLFAVSATRGLDHRVMTVGLGWHRQLAPSRYEQNLMPDADVVPQANVGLHPNKLRPVIEPPRIQDFMCLGSLRTGCPHKENAVVGGNFSHGKGADLLERHCGVMGFDGVSCRSIWG